MKATDPFRDESTLSSIHSSLPVLESGPASSRDSGPLNQGKVMGLPLGNFGWFSSLLIALSSGFLAFFLTAFFAIFGILLYNTVGHHSVDFAVAYKMIALPVGLIVLVVSLLLLGFLWIRRKLAGNPR